MANFLCWNFGSRKKLLSFAVLRSRSVHRCVRGSKYPFKSREVSEEFTLAVAGLQLYSEF